MIIFNTNNNNNNSNKLEGRVGGDDDKEVIEVVIDKDGVDYKAWEHPYEHEITIDRGRGKVTYKKMIAAKDGKSVEFWQEVGRG